jgi:hypothetical protein
MKAAGMPETSASTHNATPQKIVTTIFTPDRIQNLRKYKIKPTRY